MSETRPARTRTAKVTFAEIVLVCRKCARRQGLTKKQARALAKAACRAPHPDAAAGAQGRPKARIVESGCLGPCPKRLLAVATGASVAAGRALLLDPRGKSPPSPISAPLPR